MRAQTFRACLGLLVGLGLVAGSLTPLQPVREAVAAVATVTTCDETTFDAALDAVQTTGGGIVSFGCSGTLIFASEKSITADVTIDGTGQAVSLHGRDSNRLFSVANGARLALVNMTLEHGSSFSTGGAVYNEGTLSITDSTLRDNGAGGGGALYNLGSLSLTDSVLSGNSAVDGGAFLNNGSATLSNSVLSSNSASGRGGAIFSNDGTLTILDSTLSGNSANTDGGGIYNFASVTITGSTLSGNRATRDGGAIYNTIGMTISNSTLSGNTATSGSGGGVYNTTGTTRITNSTLNLNTAAGSNGGSVHHASGNFHLTASIVASSGTNCAGLPVTSHGENLSDDASCNLTVTGDLASIDPMLGGLADNGGSTTTHLPSGDSPALGAAPSCPTSVDQRGVIRPQDSSCDSGAVEVQTVSVATPTVDSEPSDEGQSVIASAAFSNPDGAGPVACTVDYGAGDGPQTGTVDAGVCAGPAHAYAAGDAAGSVYTVTVTVTDANIGSDSNTTSHTVDNVAPSIDGITADGPVNEGSPVTLAVTASDPGIDDILSYAFDCDNSGDYETAGAGNTGQCVFVDDGDYIVGVQVTDNDGGSATASTNIAVNNVAPIIDSIATNGPVSQGQPVTITVQASDPGVDDVLSYAFDCDDDGNYETAGAGNQASCTLDPAIMTTTVGVQISDDDGGVTTGSVTINQQVTLCLHYGTGVLSPPAPGGACNGGATAMTLPGPAPLTFCISIYDGGIAWSQSGGCSAGERAHIVPDSGPLFYCSHLWTNALRVSWIPNQCSAYEQPGVIPG